MKALDYAVLTLVVLILIFAVRRVIKRKASGAACGCGGCAGCGRSGSCADAAKRT